MASGCRSTSWICVFLSVMTILSLVPSSIVGQTKKRSLPEELADGQRCASPHAIRVPGRAICLVPVRAAYDWLSALETCERAGGTLYQPDSLLIDPDTTAMQCLAAMDNSTSNNFWFNGVGFWFQHFYWINGTLVNPATYCTTRKPPEVKAPFVSESLSVDFCVSACHDYADRFIVIHHTEKDPQCYCLPNLPYIYKGRCDIDHINYSDGERYYVVQSRENALVRVTESNAFTISEVLCTTVDKNTISGAEMKSDSCFTRRPFICDLGDSTECSLENCQGNECLFTSRNRCMKRASYDYTWFEARTYCNNLGGDLWTMSDYHELGQLGQYLDKETKYWIGGTNFVWSFEADSSIIEPYRSSNFKHLRCADLFYQQHTRWQFRGSWCSQPKSFLCQFAMDPDSFPDTADVNMTCPWPIPTPPIAAKPTPTKTISTTPIPTKTISTTPIPTKPILTKTISTTPIPTTPISITPIPTKIIPTKTISIKTISTTPIPTKTISNTPIPTTPISITPIPTKTISNTPIPTKIISTKTISNTPIPTKIISTKTISNTPIPTKIISTKTISNTPIPTKTISNTPIPTKIISNTPIPTKIISTKTISNTPIPTTTISTTPIPTKIISTKTISTTPNPTKTISTTPIPTKTTTPIPTKTTTPISTTPIPTRNDTSPHPTDD